MTEIWKDIKDYEGLYQVSNYGRVRSLDRCDNMGRSRKGSIMTVTDNGKGYRAISLSKNGARKTYKVHRLVAEAFIPNNDNLPQINHKDENRYNNHVDNLEWCSSKYNNNYGNHKKNVGKASKKRWQDKEYRKKVITAKIGLKHSEETKRKMSESAKKKVRCIETGEEFNSMQDAAETYNRHYSNLGRAIKNNKIFAGYHWEFIN